MVMTISDKTDLQFNNEWASDYGLIAVVLNGGLFEDIFSAPREIIEYENIKEEKLGFQKVRRGPIEFDINLAFEKEFTSAELEEVKNWLLLNKYANITFKEHEDRYLRVIAQGDPRIFHTGTNQGYITISFKTDSPYLYYEDVTKTTSVATTLDFKNPSDNLDGEFIIGLTKNSTGPITLSVNGRNLVIPDIQDGEVVTINTERESISSSNSTLYYTTMTGEIFYLSLKPEETGFKVSDGANYSITMKAKDYI